MWVSDDGGSDQGGSNQGGEKWSDSRCVIMIESMGLQSRLVWTFSKSFLLGESEECLREVWIGTAFNVWECDFFFFDMSVQFLVKASAKMISKAIIWYFVQWWSTIQ